MEHEPEVVHRCRATQGLEHPAEDLRLRPWSDEEQRKAVSRGETESALGSERTLWRRLVMVGGEKRETRKLDRERVHMEDHQM